MSKQQTKRNNNEEKFIQTCFKRLEKNRQEPKNETNRPNEWYDFYSRTNEIIVPSKWVSRLEQANAVNEQFQHMREKLEEISTETEKVDREALYCSSALHKMRQNIFHKRLTEHQTRWQSVMLIGELASSLPRPTTDPKDIEKQLFYSIKNRVKMLRRPLTKIDIKVDEIEDLNAAIQERKTQKPNVTNRDQTGGPVLPPPSQSVFSFLDGTNTTPR